MISPEDVRKLASLARIKLTDAEVQKFAGEIDSIVGYVADVQKAKTDDTDIYGKATNVLREDQHPLEPGIHTEAILDETPKREGDYLKVKKILS